MKHLYYLFFYILSLVGFMISSYHDHEHGMISSIMICLISLHNKPKNEL